MWDSFNIYGWQHSEWNKIWIKQFFTNSWKLEGKFLEGHGNKLFCKNIWNLRNQFVLKSNPMFSKTYLLDYLFMGKQQSWSLKFGPFSNSVLRVSKIAIKALKSLPYFPICSVEFQKFVKWLLHFFPFNILMFFQHFLIRQTWSRELFNKFMFI